MSRIFPVNEGTTYGDVYKEASVYMPEDINTQYGTPSWEAPYEEELDRPVEDSIYSSLYLTSKYAGKTIVYTIRLYYNTEGIQDRRTKAYKPYVLDEGTTTTELNRLLSQ